MTVDFYSSAAAVITRTGIKPDDLGQADDAALTTFLEELLSEVSDLMNRVMRKSYLPAGNAADAGNDQAGDPDEAHTWAHDDDSGAFDYVGVIPRGLNGIAADAASNAVREMVATRQTPVVRIDDFAVRVIQSNVLSPDIRARLKLYAAGRGAVSVDIGEDQLAPLPDILTAAALTSELP